MNILALLDCCAPLLSRTTIRQFARIAAALLCMTGRVTMLGISRWGADGASYRTVQRFFAAALPWPEIAWRFFQQHIQQAGETYILAGDEVVVSKAGKHTHGLDRFYAGLSHKTVQAVSFFSLALVGTTSRRAYPIRTQQVVRSAEERAASAANTAAKKAGRLKPGQERRPAGRPKGVVSQPKPSERNPELQRIQAMLNAQMQLLAGKLAVVYLVLDGHFGTSPALGMVRECGLQLISKLRCNTALYLPYSGSYPGRGPHRKYGDKLDPTALPESMLQTRSVADGVESSIYQGQVLHKEFEQALNVVYLLRRKLSTDALSYVILFSSDLELGYEQLVDYYSLRFQIEFTFRDAKQHWGLEDFMNVKSVPVNNAANLALFMVSLSRVLVRQMRAEEPHSSVLDLRAHYRGRKYVEETIKMLTEKPHGDLITHIMRRVGSIGRVHPPDAYPDAA